MERKDVVTILSYKRNSRVWVCNECETENQIDFTRCIVCGMNRQTTSRILETWEKEQQLLAERGRRAYAPQPEIPAFKGGWVNSTPTPPSTYTPYSYPEKSSSGGDKTLIAVLIGLAVAIAIIILIVLYQNY